MATEHEKALLLARDALRRHNPNVGLPATFGLGMAFAGAGENISELSEEEWVEELARAGITDDEAMLALEDLASFGVTDESIGKGGK